MSTHVYQGWMVSGMPMYAFVHGNWALANSAGGAKCGVDNEMQILAETGCYADLTLPSAPDRSQVPRINAIYQCGHPLNKRIPHRSGPDLRAGDTPKLPIIFNGPLVVDFARRQNGIRMPRFDSGVLTANYPLSLNRFEHWRRARIAVRGRPEWVFIKLYCHGFFEADESVTIGDELKRFLGEVLELGTRTREFKVHFATAREAFNIIMAAVDGHSGHPTHTETIDFGRSCELHLSCGAASELYSVIVVARPECSKRTLKRSESIRHLQTVREWVDKTDRCFKHYPEGTRARGRPFRIGASVRVHSAASANVSPRRAATTFSCPSRRADAGVLWRHTGDAWRP